jgi:hypothetical protein
MISINECKKILNRNGRDYTEEQIKLIRDFLLELAKLEVKTFTKIDFYEDSSFNGQSKF